MHYPSSLVENAVNEISRLPGIGKKTALRLVLHLLREDKHISEDLAGSIIKLRNEIKYCEVCHIIADSTKCNCYHMNTDMSILCIVEDTPDVLAIKSTGQYNGMFHVLGGRISPINGIGPDELNIKSLIKRINNADGEIKEVILALSSTMEGDTTSFYLSKQLQDNKVMITSIARGIPIGGELEYADELTIGRSISSRTPFSSLS